jgi:hypothetical protein
VRHGHATGTKCSGNLCLVSLRRIPVEATIGQEQPGQNPRHDHQRAKNPRTSLRRAIPPKLIFHPHSKAKGNDKQNTEENEHAVNLERRIDAGCGHKRQNSQEEDAELRDQPMERCPAEPWQIHPAGVTPLLFERLVAVGTAHGRIVKQEVKETKEATEK